MMIDLDRPISQSVALSRRGQQETKEVEVEVAGSEEKGEEGVGSVSLSSGWLDLPQDGSVGSK
jgi:hypothetical protein